MKALLIAEKPSLQAAIEEVYKKHKSEIPYDITFTAQRGHLVTLKQPDELSEDLKEWSWDTLPFHPNQYGGWGYKLIRERKQGNFLTSQERFQKIKAELDSDKYDFVINAGDPDQEGELLIWLVLMYAGNKLPVKRYWSNDMTEMAVLQALKNLRDDDHDPFLRDLLSAAIVRQRSDWLFGMNLSRAATKKASARVAMGRVMTAVLAIIVKREQEIRSFKPTTAYGLKANYAEGFDGVLYSAQEQSEENKSGTVWFQNRKDAQALMQALPKQGTVIDFEAKEVKTQAPKLYKLATAQIDAGKMGYDADRTLDIIQSLYEKKLLTYPRTDCEYVSSHENFAGILQAVGRCNAYADITNVISPADISRVKHNKRYANDDALKDSGHSGLHPTEITPDLSKLSPDEQKIYDMVTKRFLAVFLPPIRQNKTTLTADINGNYFRSTGKTLIDPGFSVLYGTKFTDNQIPVHQKGDTLDVSAFAVTSKTTTCPKRFTTADMIAVMESPAKYLEDSSYKSLGKDLSLGTPATRSGIIRKLINPGKGKNGKPLESYVTEKAEKKKKYLYPTKLGEAIIARFGFLDICKVDMTGQWEIMLNDVRTGKMRQQDLEQKMYEAVVKDVESIRNASITSIPNSSGKEFVSCLWEGKQRSYNRVYMSHRFTDEECKLLEEGREITFFCKNSSGDKCQAAGSLGLEPWQGKEYLKFIRSKLINLNPLKELMEINWNGETLQCMRFWNGGKKRFTDEEKNKLEQKKDISFTTQTKSGKDMIVTGHLIKKQTKSGQPYLKFDAIDFDWPKDPNRIYGKWKGKDISFKRIVMQHTVTDEEGKHFLNDEDVPLDVITKRGNSRALFHLKNDVYNGRPYVKADLVKWL